jgi:hypothetical protein
MKLLKAMLIGAVIGGVAGFAAPGVLYEYLRSTDPGFDRPGDSAGTFFSLLTLFTTPAGMGLGALIAAAFGRGLRD